MFPRILCSVCVCVQLYSTCMYMYIGGISVALPFVLKSFQLYEGNNDSIEGGVRDTQPLWAEPRCN